MLTVNCFVDLSTLASESEADDSFIVQTPQAALVFQDGKLYI